MRPPKAQAWQNFTPRKRRIVNKIMRTMSAANVWIYRKSAGRLGGRFFEGTRVCLLTTIGRKSGLPRTVPLLHLREDDGFIVVASKGGDYRHPLWYLNLVANPDVEVEVDRDRFQCEALIATPEQKAQLWPRLVTYYPGFQDYQDIAERDIPVVILRIRASTTNRKN